MSASETPLVDAAMDALADDQRGAVHYNGGNVIDFARALESDHRAMREALEKMASMNQHSGDGHHCTCSQRAREEYARSVLAGLKVKA